MTLPPIRTRLTDLFASIGLKVPIISAPMALAVGTDLPQAVYRAGALGLIPAGWDSADILVNNLKTMRRGLGLADDVPLPVGLGFIVCMLDAKGGVKDDRLEAVLRQKPAAVLLAFSDHMAGYPFAIREIEKKLGEYRTKLIVTVNSVQEALTATYDWKVDVINVQGHEAGGHSRNTAPPLYTFLQAVLDAIPPHERPVITAAGGVFTGAQMAGLLTLGADGVVVGSRFLTTQESIFTTLQKDVLVEADFLSAGYNTWLDETNGQKEWPPTIGARNIRNKNFEDYHAGVSLAERKARLDDGIKNQVKDRLFIWAGISAGHIKKRDEKAGDVVKELHEGCIETLQETHKKFGF